MAAALPLLLAHGPAVTTRQIAEAAGVAEGTIFRVFPDKQSLIEAAVESALDATSMDDALDHIDQTLDLESRLVAAVDILRRRVADVHQLRTVMETLPTSGGARGLRDWRHPPDLGRLAALLEPDRDRLRRDPLEAAHLLRGLTITGTHPALILDRPLSSIEIVSLFLDGVRCDTTPSPDQPENRC